MVESRCGSEGEKKGRWVMRKGDVVKFAVPENERDVAMRFVLCEDTDSLKPGDSLHIQEIDPNTCLPGIMTVHVRDVVPV
jgi:hypothetical protein